MGKMLSETTLRRVRGMVALPLVCVLRGSRVTEGPVVARRKAPVLQVKG